MKKKEKEVEAALKSYRRKYVQRNPQWANEDAMEAKMKDEGSPLPLSDRCELSENREKVLI